MLHGEHHDESWGQTYSSYTRAEFCTRRRVHIERQTIAVSENASALENRTVNECLCSTRDVIKFFSIARIMLSSSEPWENAYQILLFVILYVQRQILESVLESRSNRERFFHVAYANTICLGQIQNETTTWRTHMCVIPSAVRVSRDFEAWKGPKRSPGRIS
jgi:hypothetical protein